MKIVFLTTRATKPSFRFRVQALLPLFEQQGHVCRIEALPKSAFGRILMYRNLGDHDAVFLQKRLVSRSELFFLRRRAARLIYDLDDAVMYDSTGSFDPVRALRFHAMMEAADLVACGNDYLAELARNAGGNAITVPTAIDTSVFHPRCRSHKNTPPVIGWSGSRSTNRYLNDLFPVLARFAGRACLRIISDSTEGLDLSLLENLETTFVPWSIDDDVAEAAKFDIGVMPLPDNGWTRGKCGFKALQYMALGIPAVCSPVGANSQIIRHECDGYLADSPDDWYQTLARLIADDVERERMGAAGRRSVEQAYALDVLGPRVVQAVESLLNVDRVSA